MSQDISPLTLALSLLPCLGMPTALLSRLCLGTSLLMLPTPTISRAPYTCLSALGQHCFCPEPHTATHKQHPQLLPCNSLKGLSPQDWLRVRLSSISLASLTLHVFSLSTPTNSFFLHEPESTMLL